MPGAGDRGDRRRADQADLRCPHPDADGSHGLSPLRAARERRSDARPEIPPRRPPPIGEPPRRMLLVKDKVVGRKTYGAPVRRDWTVSGESRVSIEGHGMGIWDDLRQRIKVEFASAGKVETSSPEDLDRFEKESGFRLPDDYGEFATTFGPGTCGRGCSSMPPLRRVQERQCRPRHAQPGLEGRLSGIHRLLGQGGLSRVVRMGPSRRHRSVLPRPWGLSPRRPDGEVPDAPPIKVASTVREFIFSFAVGQSLERSEYNDGAYAYDGSSATRPIAFSQVI